MRGPLRAAAAGAGLIRVPFAAARVVRTAALAVAASSILTAVSAAGAPRPATPCYDLQVGPWQPNPPAGADSLLLALPTRIRLVADEPHALPPGVQGGELAPEEGPSWSPPGTVRTAPGALGSVHEHRSWQRHQDGRLLLIFASGGSGVRVHVDGAGRGAARAHWDLPVPGHQGPVRLEAVDCEAPLSPDAAFRWVLSPRVPVPVEPALLLGAPVPEAHGGHPEVHPAPELLPHPREVELVAGAGGRLTRVIIRFAAEAERIQLLDALEARWGPVHVMYGTVFRWLTRMQRYTLQAMPDQGWILTMEVPRLDDLPDATRPPP